MTRLEGRLIEFAGMYGAPSSASPKADTPVSLLFEGCNDRSRLGFEKFFLGIRACSRGDRLDLGIPAALIALLQPRSAALWTAYRRPPNEERSLGSKQSVRRENYAEALLGALP
jgi:hypothetical protein